MEKCHINLNDCACCKVVKVGYSYWLYECSKGFNCLKLSECSLNTKKEQVIFSISKKITNIILKEI